MTTVAPSNEYRKTDKYCSLINKFRTAGVIYERVPGIQGLMVKDIPQATNHWNQLFIDGFRTVQRFPGMVLLRRGAEHRMYLSRSGTSAPATIR